MSTTVACPSCGRTQPVEEESLGTPVVCSACGSSFDAATPAAPKRGTPWSVTPNAPPGTTPAPSAAPRDGETPDGADEEPADERPWEQRHRDEVRRDCEPHRGTLVLVLGILGLVVPIPLVGLIIALCALAMGRADLKKIDSGAMDPDGKGTTLAGWICGIIGTIWQTLFLLGFLAYVGLIAFVILAMTRAMPAPAPPAPVPGPMPPMEKKAAALPRLQDYLPQGFLGVSC